MKTLFRIAADATVCFHMAYVLFVVLGQAAVIVGAVCGWNWIRNTTFRLLHLLAISIVVVESWLGITCPLTTVEKYLRAKSGVTSDNGDFIANTVHDALFIECEPCVFTYPCSPARLEHSQKRAQSTPHRPTRRPKSEISPDQTPDARMTLA